jgi:hypothetical protein
MVDMLNLKFRPHKGGKGSNPFRDRFKKKKEGWFRIK